MRHWVKFHFRTQQGIKNLTDQQAQAVIGEDRKSHGRELFGAIERGDFPRWKLFVQVMPQADAQGYRFHPFDLTKVGSQQDHPMIEVGEYELNRNRTTTLPTSSRPRSLRPTWCRASPTVPTRCCRAGCSPTVTPPGTEWG